MLKKVKPKKGKWYYRFDLGKNFKVVDVDEVECVVRVQYLGGDIDEISIEQWEKLELQKTG